jgi:hypothetical protein
MPAENKELISGTKKLIEQHSFLITGFVNGGLV